VVTNEPYEKESEMSVTENDDLMEKSQAANAAEISLEYDEEQGPDDIALSDAAEELAGEPANPMVDDLDSNVSDDNDDDAPLVENSMAADGTNDEAAADEKNQEGESPPDGDDADLNDPPENDLRAEVPEESQTGDFGDLDDDEIAKMSPEQNQPRSEENIPDTMIIDGEPEETAAENMGDNDTLMDHSPLKEFTEKTTSTPETPEGVAGFSLANKIIGGALIAVIIAGFVLYYNPSLIGLTKAQKPTTPSSVKDIEAVAPVVQPVTTPSAPNKRDQCLAKIEEAVRLRNLLLEKNEEIYELDLHYRKGIAELEEETYQQLKRAGTTSYDAAMKNKPIELNLRTIQRRRAYINGLIKPAFWLNSGSEELFYLVRKAQLNMQLTEIAGGIDLKKHMRHIDAAIQKYRPSPDKIAVDPQQVKAPSLEKIWQQISRKEQADGNREKKTQLALNPKDKRIINQICSGNFTRIAELTNISSTAARCLARMKGSDLFLNGLMTLSPDTAQQLFQWQGNWICLNGVKNLSPATAQYLFGWKGNWISLNGLSDFPPELAELLLKWEGQQLELMGLKYNKTEASQKTLKYLALWETTGGKLFVTDKIRQKMESLM
jgi:hypothetical protein